MIETQIIIINSFGEFCGKKIVLTRKQLKEVTDVARKFHSGGGFELNLEDGSFVVFSPNIVQNSILKIIKIELETEEEDTDVQDEV